MFETIKRELIEETTDVELLLVNLQTERQKFTKADDDLLRALVNRLIEIGEYPATGFAGHSAFQMMDGWGAYWHRYQEPLNCPHCETDLRDLKAGPPGKREIGIYSRERDRTMHYQCPDCQGVIPREAKKSVPYRHTLVT